MADIIARMQASGIGWIIALLVLIICVVLLVIGQALTPFVVLVLIGLLALSRLL